MENLVLDYIILFAFYFSLLILNAKMKKPLIGIISIGFVWSMFLLFKDLVGINFYVGLMSAVVSLGIGAYATDNMRKGD